MASSLLALLDDIVVVLDDVAILAKVAAKKSAGVLGDDMALNAQQVAGVRADRELPVVWAVAKGSMKNKAILVPAALLISAFAPWAITPLLMLGGAFLCYEGAEKLAHKWIGDAAARREAEVHAALLDPNLDMAKFEADKIKGAIRTDFVLSAEIIVITLGTVAASSMLIRVSVLATIALLMTVGVYGLVALIVKIDDAGLWLTRTEGRGSKALGALLLGMAPWLMKFLVVAGTAAMFLVGGGILAHSIAPIQSLGEALAARGGFAGFAGPLAIDAGVGLSSGALLVALHAGWTWMRGRKN